VEIVEDRRVPREEALEDVLRQLQPDSDAVAVVVVLHVLAPVDQARLRLARVLQAEIEVVDHLLAPIDFGRRRQHDDRVVADRLDEGRLLDGEAERQLDQHLGAAGLRRVDAARRVVDRLAGGDELFRFRVLQLARIGQLRGDVAILVELLDRRLVGDGERDHVAPFFTLAEPEQLDPRRRLLQRFVVADDIGVVGEMAGLAGHVAEELQRRRHGRRDRHVIDELGDDARIGRRLLDPGGVVLVQLLRRGRHPRPLRVRGRRNRRHREQQPAGETLHPHRTPPGVIREEYIAVRVRECGGWVFAAAFTEISRRARRGAESGEPHGSRQPGRVDGSMLLGVLGSSAHSARDLSECR
jgi:hypothetical protein